MEKPPKTEMVDGAFGQHEVVHVYTPEEVEQAMAAGQGVPLDQMPAEHWWVGELPRYGEEMLGSEF